MYLWGIVSLHSASFLRGTKLSFSVSLRIEKFTYFIGGCFQIKKLKGQLEERQKNGKLDNLRPGDDVLENGTDVHVMDLQSKCQPLCRSECFTCPIFIIFELEEKNHPRKKSLVFPLAAPKPLSTRVQRSFCVGLNKDGQVGGARMFLSEPKE